jgi:cell shape-determining protein MreC
MRWILELIVRYRNWASLAVILLASLFMISSPPSLQAKTARLLTVSVFYPLQITFDQMLRAKNIYAENRRLKSEVALLSARVMQLGEQAVENNRLRGMLTFEQETPYDLLPVRVVARDASPVSRSVVIGAGKNKGVLLYMPVVGECGIAGKVVQVMPGLSLVQLVNEIGRAHV